MPLSATLPMSVRGSGPREVGASGYRRGMDDAPRPRILFESVPDELFESLARCAPTVGRYLGDVARIHATDWDLVVSFHAQPEEPDGVHVLSFGGDRFTRIQRLAGSSATRGWELHARAVRRDDACPSEFASLVDRTIVATAPPPPRLAFATGPASWLQALAVIGAEQAPYAGIMRSDSGSLTLAVPEHTTDHAAWLSAFIDYLRALQPERFPAAPDWQRRWEWATPTMRASLRELDELSTKRAAVLERLAAEEASTRAALDRGAASATAGAQRVLTSDGDGLVAGVFGLLKDLGFTVENRDDHHDQKSGAKLEDLLVTDDGWACLAEVKGYTKGAKVNEVPKIAGRPSVAFAAERGNPPDAVWHIVNTWRDTDPTTRPAAIPSDLDLAPLAEADGCLIDTRDLFCAWRDVQEGRAAAEEVRSSLRNAVTRWSWSVPAA